MANNLFIYYENESYQMWMVLENGDIAGEDVDDDGIRGVHDRGGEQNLV